MHHWWVRLIGRGVSWALLGGIYTALTGALCGAGAGLLIGWPDSLHDGVFSLFGGMVGVVTGGLLGAVLCFILNFFCSAERKAWRPPVRYLLIGMLLGAAGGLLFALPIAFCLAYLGSPNSGFMRLHWWYDAGSCAMLSGPIGMMLLQIAGAVYDVLIAERREHKAELKRWNRIIESDYDLPYAHPSR